MCLSPLKLNIEYRSKYYYPGHPQLSVVEVPCGRCDSCLADARNDYLIRMHSEYVMNRKQGGKVAFLTFTYSDDNVPAYAYTLNKDSRCIEFKKVNPLTSNLPFIYAFDKKHVQRMFDSYRKHLAKQGIANNFRYFLVPEYGTDSKKTQRPHFHALIYLSPDMVKYYRSDYKFLYDIRHYWHLGIVNPSPLGVYVNGDAAIKYTAKYISKTTVLEGLLRFKQFYKYIEDNIKFISLPDSQSTVQFKEYTGVVVDDRQDTVIDFDNGIKLDVKYSTPFCPDARKVFRYYIKQIGSNLFTMKSKNFGLYALNEIYRHISYYNLYEFDLDEKIVEKVADFYYKGYKIIWNGETKYIPFSNYYRRKILYKTRKDGSFALTRLGYYVNNILAEYKIYDYIDDVVKLDSSNIKNIPDISKKFNVSSLISQFDEFRSDVDNVKSLALYVKYVKGYSIPFGSREDMLYYLFDDSVNVQQSVRYFLSHWYRLVDSIHYYDAKEIDSSLDNFAKYKLNNPRRYHDPYKSSLFDVMDYVVTQLMRLDSISKHEEYKEKASRAKYLRDVHNLTKYK